MTKMKFTAFAVLAIILVAVLFCTFFFHNPTVAQVAATEILTPQLSQKTLELDMDICGKLFPIGFSNEANLKWTSQNPSIADVSYGVVTPKAIGETTITCTDGTNTAQCQISVLSDSDTLDYKLFLHARQINLKVGNSRMVKYTYTGNRPITVFSSNPQVLKVENGRYTAIGEGTAIITCTDGVKNAQCIVNVTNSSLKA